VQNQQPKTSLNDAFKLLERYEALGKAKRTSEARNVAGQKQRMMHRRKS